MFANALTFRKDRDRTNFTHYGNDLATRVKAWNAAARAARQLAEEFGEWVERGGCGAGRAFVTDTRVRGKAFAVTELGAENDRFALEIGWWGNVEVTCAARLYRAASVDRRVMFHD